MDLNTYSNLRGLHVLTILPPYYISLHGYFDSHTIVSISNYVLLIFLLIEASGIVKAGKAKRALRCF